ncbi:MAG: hypothetical protein ACD_75C01485G0002 [uncultured bacterium]|nr:MAG: hypothetical protein ACD_75C01485G0002 [uncultured bacterium]
MGGQDIVFGHYAARTGRGNLVQIDAQFPGQPSGGRGGRNWSLLLSRCGWRLRLGRWRRAGPLGRGFIFFGPEGHEDAADDNSLPDLDQDLGHLAGNRRRDFHRRLVGLDLQNDIAFFHLLAGSCRDGENLRLMHAFTEIRQPKGCRHTFSVVDWLCFCFRELSCTYAGFFP